jgi:hypothetical protein
MKKLIMTKSERYVSHFSEASKPSAPKTSEDEITQIMSDYNLNRNEYINIVRVYELKYKI